VTGSCTCGVDTPGATRSCTVENALGACYGAQTCDPDLGWGACDAGTPEPEACDGVDNDCNGIVDDGLAEGGVCLNEVIGVGTCEGIEVCLGSWSCQGQVPEGETCNFKDDDCDGAVDEDWPELGAVCVVGLGRCERRGTRVCLGGADACDAVPGEGREEACDRVDDDCDGVVDEGTGDCCEPGEQRPCGR
ncbi:MAG: MopE-related protein, partial [Myxococcota bacterium]|nr:MopE-related protein [Myxococcota bacterium]